MSHRKIAFQEDPDKEEFTVDGRKVTPEQLSAIRGAFPGDWLIVRFEGEPFTETKKRLNTKTEFEYE